MKIFVNGNLAKIKEGTSFDLICENRDFSDAEAYTFNISFPLSGCPENIRIFGHLDRPESVIPDKTFECEIHAGHFSVQGILVISEISGPDVKCQFLEGRSVDNYVALLDDIYIDELNLGSGTNPLVFGDSLADNIALVGSSVEQKYWSCTGNGYAEDRVYLPWVDADGKPYNRVKNTGNQAYSFLQEEHLSFQPYFLPVMKYICSAAGITYDFSEWEANFWWSYLLICNSVPTGSQPTPFNLLLPHWTLSELLHELEIFMNVSFAFDPQRKHLSMTFNPSDGRDTVAVDPVGSFSVECSSDNFDDDPTNIRYKYDGDDDVWSLYDCTWFIDSWRNGKVTGDYPFVEYDTFNDLWAAVKDLLYYSSKFSPPSTRPLEGKAYYVKDEDAYYILTRRLVQESHITDDGLVSGNGNIIQWHIYNHLCHLNPFGHASEIGTGDDAPTEVSMRIVPVSFTDTVEKGDKEYVGDFDGHKIYQQLWNDYGRCMKLPYTPDSTGTPVLTGTAIEQVTAGAPSSPESAYDKIYVGFWTGGRFTPDPYPYPAVTRRIIADCREPAILDNAFPNLAPRDRTQSSLRPDLKRKYKFSFLSKKIPNVRSIFLIRGKRYLCRKITATFRSNGMSELLKGEFYRIID